MDRLTDLELCKRIAEIEGYGPNEINDKSDVIFVLIGHATMEFNPLTDKALLWDLMIKHRDVIARSSVISKDDVPSPRLFLEAIVEANNGN